MKLPTLIAALAMLIASSAPMARAQETQRPLVADFLGINGHTVAFRPALYAPLCSLVRDYHPVDWDLAKDTSVLPDFPLAKNKVDWSSIYGSWQRNGFRTDACLMIETVKHWHDPDADAFAYGKAFAAKFGPSSPMPLVQSVEIGNEPGKIFDAQFAELFRNVARGIRAGDPRLPIVTCSVTTGESTAYAKSVSTLAGLDDLYDVLNIHTYAQLEPYPTWRRSYPEDPRLNYLRDVLRLADWRDENAHGKPIWITEFGYDATTKSPDPKTEFAKWVGVTDLQQAQYLVRSVLIFCTLPVERAYIYFFNDQDEPHVHGSSGLTRNFVPKPAYYAIAHLQKVLGNYRFTRTLLQRPGDVFAYEFAHATDPHQRIVAVWSPTQGGRTTTVSLDLPGWKIIGAQTMALADDTSFHAPIPPASAIPVTESPLYLLLHSSAGR